ncbi:MAG: phosphatase PAP2 family protein [Bacteroidota bacterium]
MPASFLTRGCALLLLCVLAHTSAAQQAYEPGEFEAPVGLVLTIEDSPGVERFLRWAGQDALAFLRTTGTTLPLIALAGSALVPTAANLDGPISDELQGQPSGPLGTFLDVGDRLGERKMALPVVALFGASLLTDNYRFQDAAFTSMQSAFYATGVAMGLKSLVGRARPYTDDGALAFVPLSPSRDYYSFPSGHTTLSFAVVTPWVIYYPNALTYSLLAVSTGTAIARIAKDEHWATDVLAGAAIGAFTGVFLARRHLREAEARAAFQVQPIVSAEHVGASVTIPIR